jgi:hypothetical protein
VHDPAERNRIVAEVAERAAAEIRTRAEAEARRLSEERRRTSDAFLAEQRSALSELDRATMHHLAVVKARTEELLGTLRATIERAAEPPAVDVPIPGPDRIEPVPAPTEPIAASPADTVVVPPAPPPAEQPAPASVPPAAEPGPGHSASGASGRGRLLYHSTEATALAAQMATAGSSRDDIVRALRERFSISEAEPLADEAMARYGS